jgi:hypothetical protein
MKWLFLGVVPFLGLVGLNWRIESNTKLKIEQLTMELRDLAPVGRPRPEVEQALKTHGLEHVFGISDNAIYGKKLVGRYRLVYATELDYKVLLGTDGRVRSIELIVFNEGL